MLFVEKPEEIKKNERRKNAHLPETNDLTSVYLLLLLLYTQYSFKNKNEI